MQAPCRLGSAQPRAAGWCSRRELHRAHTRPCMVDPSQVIVSTHAWLPPCAVVEGQALATHSTMRCAGKARTAKALPAHARQVHTQGWLGHWWQPVLPMGLSLPAQLTFLLAAYRAKTHLTKAPQAHPWGNSGESLVVQALWGGISTSSG